MAIKYLDGSAFDLASTTSWKDSPFGATGATLPALGDSIVCNEPGIPLTANLDALAGVALASASFGPFFDKTTPIGSAVSLQSTVVDFQGTGRFAIASATLIGTLRANAGNASVTITGSGAIGKLVAIGRQGIVILDSSSAPAEVWNIGSRIIASSGSQVALVHHISGTTEWERPIGNLIVSGEVASSRVKVTGNSPIGTLDHHGGFVNYRSSATITTLNAFRGVLTPEGATGNPTITTRNINTTDDEYKFFKRVGNIEFNVGSDGGFGKVTDQFSNLAQVVIP